MIPPDALQIGRYGPVVKLGKDVGNGGVDAAAIAAACDDADVDLVRPPRLVEQRVDRWADPLDARVPAASPRRRFWMIPRSPPSSFHLPSSGMSAFRTRARRGRLGEAEQRSRGRDRRARGISGRRLRRWQGGHLIDCKGFRGRKSHKREARETTLLFSSSLGLSRQINLACSREREQSVR